MPLAIRKPDQPRFPRLRALSRRLRGDTSGLALIEFALSLPLFLGLGMFGVELAWFAVTNMNVSQVSLSIADNAARMGQTTSSTTSKTIYRSDVNSVFAGAAHQAGSIDLLRNGRIVLSSVETLGASGKQVIRWQRCAGLGDYDSDYGDENTVESNGSGFTGMGPAGRQIRAQDGEAVMYVEVFYEYNGLFGDMFIGDEVIKHEAAFPVRDDRNLGPKVANDGAHDPVCNQPPPGDEDDDDCAILGLVCILP